MAKQKKPTGAPAGNLNALKTGTRMRRLTLGLLPRPLQRQLANVRMYRRELESIVLEARGAVNTVDAHWIDEACAAETHAAICRWLLRHRFDKMTVVEMTRCSEQILKSKAVRNRAVQQLNLDAPPPDPWIDVPTGEGNGR